MVKEILLLINIEFIFLGNDNNNNPPISSSLNDVEHVYNQRHNSTEFETLCRQVSESAMSDDGK